MRALFLAGLWLCLLPAPWAAAGSCAGAVPSAAVAEAQFIAARGELYLWRQWQAAQESCVQLDWPYSQRLHGPGLRQFQQELSLDAARRQALMATSLPAANVERGRPVRGFDWLPPEIVHAPDDRPPLPLCPRVPARSAMPAVQLPAEVAATVLRVRPHRCGPVSLSPSGSGVLVAPALGLTAAHVVMSPEGGMCSRYRVIPGGRRYSEQPSAPFGQRFVYRAQTSGRGGWLADNVIPPSSTAAFAARTRHDHAWLLLDEPAALPEETVWPRLRFGAPPAPIGTPVLSAGYPVRTPRAASAPGALVALWGQVACAGVEDGGARRHALWLAAGGSGGPIFTWSRQWPFELHSLGARIETSTRERFEAVGPAFDLEDYERLLRVLDEDRGWRIAQAERRARQRETLPEAIASEPVPQGRRRGCASNSTGSMWAGHHAPTACRLR